MPISSCPWCNNPVDFGAVLSGLHSPSAGDLSICAQCSGLLVLDEKLIPQKLEPEQELKLRLSAPETYAHLTRIREVIQESNEADRRDPS